MNEVFRGVRNGFQLGVESNKEITLVLVYYNFKLTE